MKPGSSAAADGTAWCAGKRRRGQALEQAILTATLTQLRAVGYAALTIEGVAACARTGKASLYRRWGRKEDMVLDALQSALPTPFADPDTGSVREDLLVVLGHVREMLSGPAGQLVRSLFAEVDTGSEIARTLRTSLLEPRRAVLLSVLRRSDVHAASPTALEMMVDVGPAVLMHRFLLNGRIDDADVTTVVDDVLLPLAANARS